jgi:hypothetical protein
MPKRDSALRIGLIMGLVLAVTGLILTFLWQAINAEGFGGIFNIGASITILMMAGAFAARRFASPALTGLVTGVTSAIIGTPLNAILGLSNTNALSQLQQQTGTTQGEAQAVLGAALVIGTIIAAILGALFGALFGWLGGKLFGQGRDATTYRT